MPTKPCPACKENVSTVAKICPHCGHPLTVGRTGLEGAKDLFGCAIQIIVIGFIIILFIAILSS